MPTEFLIAFIRIFFNLLSFAIIARLLLSWFPQGAPRLREVLHNITEPVLGPFRRVIPRIGMFDISPLVAIWVLDIFGAVLVGFIFYFASGL